MNPLKYSWLIDLLPPWFIKHERKDVRWFVKSDTPGLAKGSQVPQLIPLVLRLVIHSSLNAS